MAQLTIMATEIPHIATIISRLSYFKIIMRFIAFAAIDRILILFITFVMQVVVVVVAVVVLFIHIKYQRLETHKNL